MAGASARARPTPKTLRSSRTPRGCGRLGPLTASAEQVSELARIRVQYQQALMLLTGFHRPSALRRIGARRLAVWLARRQVRGAPTSQPQERLGQRLATAGASPLPHHVHIPGGHATAHFAGPLMVQPDRSVTKGVGEPVSVRPSLALASLPWYTFQHTAKTAKIIQIALERGLASLPLPCGMLQLSPEPRWAITIGHPPGTGNPPGNPGGRPRSPSSHKKSPYKMSAPAAYSNGGPGRGKG